MRGGIAKPPNTKYFSAKYAYSNSSVFCEQYFLQDLSCLENRNDDTAPIMAFRIHDYIARGEIDNRVRGKVTGRIWLLGYVEPIGLTLSGNPWRDLAGCKLEFLNPFPRLISENLLSSTQNGSVGDMSASQKTRIPDVSVEDILHLSARGESYPWHWGNTLYLEWFSEGNGHVIIESSDYRLSISERDWEMSEAEEAEQRRENAGQLLRYMTRLVQAFGDEQRRKEGGATWIEHPEQGDRRQ